MKHIRLFIAHVSQPSITDLRFVECLSFAHPPEVRASRTSLRSSCPRLLRDMLEMLRWGLISSWADDPAIGNRMINARAETVSEKSSFRGAFKKRRCLILVDGFYEWQKTDNGKQPFYIHMEDVASLHLCWVVGDLEWRRRGGPLLHHHHLWCQRACRFSTQSDVRDPSP